MKTNVNSTNLQILVVRSPKFVPFWVQMKEFAHISRVRSYYANFRRQGGPRNAFLAVRPTCFDVLPGISDISMMLIAPPRDCLLFDYLEQDWLYNDPDLGGCILDCSQQEQRQWAIHFLMSSMVVDLERV